MYGCVISSEFFTNLTSNFWRGVFPVSLCITCLIAFDVFFACNMWLSLSLFFAWFSACDDISFSQTQGGTKRKDIWWYHHDSTLSWNTSLNLKQYTHKRLQTWHIDSYIKNHSFHIKLFMFWYCYVPEYQTWAAKYWHISYTIL